MKSSSSCSVVSLVLQYRPQALQHLHARKVRAIWRISTKNPRKNSRVNLNMSFYMQAFYTQIWVYFYGDWFCLQKYTQVVCISFTTDNVADVKLETDIVEKHLFAVKEKTTCYTLFLTTIMLQSRTSCFVMNDFLGCWLKRYFTCKLGSMLLATTVVLQ